MSRDANYASKSAGAEGAVTLFSEIEIHVSKLPAAANGSALDDDELMLAAIKQLDEWAAADHLPKI